jgi:PBSX family phage terminase large subunit
MDMQVTETFERTEEVFNEIVNRYEIENSKNEVVEPKYRYRQVVSMGGSRSSKSYSILQLLLLEMVSKRNLKITVWRNTKVDCRSTVMEDFQNIIMFDWKIYKDIKENKQTGTFTYVPTGSKIVFEGADNVGKVLGSTQDISFFNEVTEFKKEVYLQITQRTADRIFCDYNPSKNFWLESYRHDEDTVFIHSNFKHNFFCPPNIVKQLLSYEPWESGSYEVDGPNLTHKGKPISIHNQPPPHEKNHKRGTADEYMWLVYGLGIGAEKPNKIYKGWHHITDEEFEDLPYESYFGLDFGASVPTACVEIKYNGDGAFFLRERLYQPLQDLHDSLPTVLKTKVPQIVKSKSLVICDSAKESFLDLLKNEGYYAVKALKGAGSIEAGITIVQGFTIYFVPTPNLLFEEQNYSWSIDKYGKSTDVPLKVDDHLMDALRYGITYLTRYLSIVQ